MEAWVVGQAVERLPMVDLEPPNLEVAVQVELMAEAVVDPVPALEADRARTQVPLEEVRHHRLLLVSERPACS
jgi:hypothetical protein